MIPKVRFGKTNLMVTRLALGGYPFGGVNQAQGWDPFSPGGRNQAIETIHAAVEAGINVFDTAPGYGDGNSESIYGEALKGVRDQVVLNSKVGYHISAKAVRESVEASLRRLQTDIIDVMQFHGGMYTDAEVRHILDAGLLDMLVTLRAEGKIRYLGFTVEEPWTARPLISSGAFDVMQVRYNIIYQAAALHVLNQATEMDMGISVMRPMTSGIMQRMASYIAPEWLESSDLYAACLKFLLSDSRVHVVNVGMRWPDEVAKNVALVETYVPEFDMKNLPRMTAHIYQTEDEMAGLG